MTTGTILDAPALWNVTDGKGTIAEIVSHNQSDARLIASTPELLRALEDAEFLLRKVSNNPKEIGSMLDSLKRCAIDAREAIQSAS